MTDVILRHCTQFLWWIIGTLKTVTPYLLYTMFKQIKDLDYDDCLICHHDVTHRS